MNVDIRIQALSGDKMEIKIPILPEAIKVKYGDGQFIEYDIMGKGKVAIPSGVGLSGVSFESEFPGKYRTDRSMIRGGSAKNPDYYEKLFNRWKKEGTDLRILITAYHINMLVRVSEFSTQPSGFMGDLPYEVTFLERGSIIVTETNLKKTTSTSNNKRAAVSVSDYTVKKGDTLWAIATRVWGAGWRWTELYKANKDIIERTAKKYGRSSSDNGHWIYPGTKLTIPK